MPVSKGRIVIVKNGKISNGSDEHVAIVTNAFTTNPLVEPKYVNVRTFPDLGESETLGSVTWIPEADEALAYFAASGIPVAYYPPRV